MSGDRRGGARRDPRIRALLVILLVLAIGGAIYAVFGLVQQQLLPLIEGISLFVVALLCALYAARRGSRP